MLFISNTFIYIALLMHNLLHKKFFYVCVVLIYRARVHLFIYVYIYLLCIFVCVYVSAHSKNISNQVWNIIILNIFMKSRKIWDKGKKGFTLNNVPSV